jgi:hypothetical protein
MKKALHVGKVPFLIEKCGKLEVWNPKLVDGMLELANMELKGETGGAATIVDELSIIRRELYAWLRRYLKEGVNENLLNDLNSAMHSVRFSNYLVPTDLVPSQNGYPKSVFAANFDEVPAPKVFAAFEFSKFLSSGVLHRLRRCQSQECESFFIGPPQAKWCSKACGSKVRVNKMRKRNSA